MRTNLSLDGIGALVQGIHSNPFELLGPHEVSQGEQRAMAVRAYLPHSQQAWVIDAAHRMQTPMRRIHPAGLYEAICPLEDSPARHHYQLRVATEDGRVITMHDPYAFAPLLSDFDLYLLGEGKFLDAYQKLGAQLRTIDGVAGVNFAVWAPNAQSVSVVGDFNAWDGRLHPMRKHVPSGVWELFIPGLSPGEKYKFRIKSQVGDVGDRSDPYGFPPSFHHARPR